MANDMSSAMDMLKDLLDSPDAGEKIGNMLSSFTGSGEKKDSVPDISALAQALGGFDSSMKNQNGDSDLPMASIMKIANVYQNLNKADDPRIILLSALRPYLQTHRHQNLDSAIRILGLIKFLPLLSELKGII